MLALPLPHQTVSKPTGMRLLLVCQFYHNPDCPGPARHYAYLRTLAQHHHITLISSRSYLNQRLTDDFDLVPEGVDLRLIDAPYANRMTARERVPAYAAFAAQAFYLGMKGPRPDLIYGVSAPLSAAWAAARVARLRRVPWVFEVNDLWPDFPIQMGAVRPPWLQRRLYRIERNLYHSATHIVTLSTDMEAHVLQKGVPPDRVTTLFHGSDLDLLNRCTTSDVASLRQQHNLDGKVVALYAGTFGRANDIPTLLEAAERLAHRDDLRFVFAGSGFFEPVLREAATRLPNVVLLPAQPRHQMLCWFKLADLALISFIDLPVLATNSPVKLFDSLAAGTPVLVTNPGWTKQFVEEHGCGWYTPPSDVAQLAQQLVWISDQPGERTVAGQRAETLARARFDRRVLVHDLDKIFRQAVSETG